MPEAAAVCGAAPVAFPLATAGSPSVQVASSNPAGDSSFLTRADGESGLGLFGSRTLFASITFIFTPPLTAPTLRQARPAPPPPAGPRSARARQTPPIGPGRRLTRAPSPLDCIAFGLVAQLARAHP